MADSEAGMAVAATAHPLTLRVAFVATVFGGLAWWALAALMGQWYVAAVGGVIAGSGIVFVTPLVVAQATAASRRRFHVLRTEITNVSLASHAIEFDVRAVHLRWAGIAWLVSAGELAFLGSILLPEGWLIVAALAAWAAAVLVAIYAASLLGRSTQAQQLADLAAAHGA